MIPQEYIKRYYIPGEQLKEILVHPKDSLENEVCAFVSELVACTGIKTSELGITGSTLLGIHNPQFSDIDLLVQGLETASKVRLALKERRSELICPPDRETLEKWSTSVSRRFPLNYEEARRLAGRRWNYGFFGDRYFSIHPTRRDHEIKEDYGSLTYKAEGIAKIRAIVVDAGESIFMPAVYKISDVEMLEGNEETQPRSSIHHLAGEARDVEMLEGNEKTRHLIKEIVSYEGLYRDVVDSNQKVEARGKLESVNNQSRYYRLVIGTTMLDGEGYIKPVTEGEIKK